MDFTVKVCGSRLTLKNRCRSPQAQLVEETGAPTQDDGVLVRYRYEIAKRYHYIFICLINKEYVTAHYIIFILFMRCGMTTVKV